MNATAELFEDVELIDAPDGPAPIIVGRSELERWVVCPHQAWLIDRGAVHNAGLSADVGSAVHEILSEAVRARAEESDGSAQLRAMIEVGAMEPKIAGRARPDIQPQVIDALRRSYPVVELLCRRDNSGEQRAPDDLLRYDGGKGERSGQLGAQLVQATEYSGGIIVTCELDLLLATVSAEELELYDWKSGWKNWTADAVKKAFQFRFYAWVIFINYQDAKRVTVRVLMTQDGSMTSAVTFERARDFFPIEKQLQAAVEIYLSHRDAQNAHDVPANPCPEYCGICPAATRCGVLNQPAGSVAAEPEKHLRQLIVLNAAVGSLKKQLNAAVRSRGEDFNFGDVAYGSGKPKKSRAATCAIYKPGADAGQDEGED